MYNEGGRDSRKATPDPARDQGNGKRATLPLVSQAVDLMALTSRPADLLSGQNGAEQRKLLHLVLQKAS